MSAAARRALACVLLAAAPSAGAYELLGPRWPSSQTSYRVDIADPDDPNHPVADWSSVFEQAMAEWNQGGDFSFSVVPVAGDPCCAPLLFHPPLAYGMDTGDELLERP